MRKRVLLSMTLAALAAPLLAATAGAATEQPFTPQSFAAAQKAGRSILVEIHAPWCPTCAKQTPILGELLKEPKFADLTVLKVDFDSQQDIVKSLGARTQSTLISYRGTTETARSVGDTNAASIRALVEKAVN